MRPDKTEDRPPPADTKMMMKKKKTNIFKVALFMLRQGKSSMHADVASKGLWRKLLGASRPLHLENKTASHSPAKAAAIVPEDDINVKNTFVEEEKTIVPLLTEKCEDIDNGAPLPHQDNPQSSPSCASSSSRYASAMNLRELDVCDEEEGDDEDCRFDDSTGDSMIDIKAEMFIAQFYEQMRLQNSQTSTYQMMRG